MFAAICKNLTAEVPCSQQGDNEDLTKPLKGSGNPQALNMLGTHAQDKLLKASGLENNYSSEKKDAV